MEKQIKWNQWHIWLIIHSVVLRKHGPCSDGRQACLLFYPLIVIGHFSVHTRTEFFCTPISPAHYSEKEEPVIQLTHQRASRVTLWKTDLEQNYKHICQSQAWSSCDLCCIPRRHPDSSQDDQHKTYYLWSCFHNSLSVHTHHALRDSLEPLLGTGTYTTSLKREQHKTWLNPTSNTIIKYYLHQWDCFQFVSWQEISNYKNSFHWHLVESGKKGKNW